MTYFPKLTAELTARRFALDLTLPPPAAVLASDLAGQLSCAQEEIDRLNAVLDTQARELKRLADEAEQAWAIAATHEWREELEGED